MPTWLITGTSRGIGLELARQLASKPANIVFATCRSPSTAMALKTLAAEHQDTVHVIELDVTSCDSARAAAEKVQAILGPDTGKGIDYLINNAGVGHKETIDVVKTEDLEAQFRVHVVGPLHVFRAFLSLIEKGKRKVVVQVTSGLGSMGKREEFGAMTPAYCIAKAGMDMLTFKLHKQYPELVIFCLTPGWIKTDMGGPNAPLELDYAISCHLRIFEIAKLETHAGKFLDYDGTEYPW